MAAFPIPANPTTGATLDTAVRLSIARRTIMANAQYRVWEQIAQVREAVSGTGADFPIMDAISVDTTALSGTASPEPTQLTDSHASITTAEYGLASELGKKLLRNSEARVLDDAVGTIATHAAEKIDLVAGTAALGGSSVRYAGGQANANALTATDIINKAEIIRAKATLELARAPKFLNGTFAAVLNSVSINDLFNSGGTAGDFMDVSKYATPETIRTGEIGQWMGFTFFRASQANIATLAAGALNVADKISSLFCGDHFLGKAVGLDITIIPARDLGDILDRFIALGWKADLGFGRIKETNGLRVVSRSAFASNP